MKFNWVNHNAESYVAVLNLPFILKNIDITLDYCRDEDCWLLKAHSNDQPDFYMCEEVFDDDPRRDAEWIIKGYIEEYLDTLIDQSNYLLKDLEK